MNKSLLQSLIVVLLLFVSTEAARSQWQVASSVTGLGSYPVISVPSSNVVWVAGGTTSTAKVARSVNGGTSFTVVTSNLAGTTYLSAIWAIDSMTAYVGDAGEPFGTGGNAKIWKTVNGGANWVFVTATGGSFGYINSIEFSRTQPNFGLIQSDPPNSPGDVYWLAKTTNAGINWIVSYPPAEPPTGTSASGGLAVVDSLMFGFGINGPNPPRILWTSNGGLNWTNTSLTGLAGNSVSGFAIKSDKSTMIAATGYGTSSLPNISRSTDTGATWNILSTGAGVSGTCTMKWVYGTNLCYLSSTIGPLGCVRKSYDNGANWVQQTTSGVSNLIAMDIVSEGAVIYGYAISITGICLKIIDNVNRVSQFSSEIPGEFKLEQNYPNPFNPLTKIRFSVPRSMNGNVRLVVYDEMGRQVEELVNENLKPGLYETEWNAQRFSSGIYFCRLITDKMVVTKKMMLVK